MQPQEKPVENSVSENPLVLPYQDQKRAYSQAMLSRPTDRDTDVTRRFANQTVDGIALDWEVRFDNLELPYIMIPPLACPVTLYDIRNPSLPVANLGPMHKKALIIPRCEGLRVYAWPWPGVSNVWFEASSREVRNDDTLEHSKPVVLIPSASRDITIPVTFGPWKNFEHTSLVYAANASPVDGTVTAINLTISQYDDDGNFLVSNNAAFESWATTGGRAGKLIASLPRNFGFRISGTGTGNFTLVFYGELHK